MTDELLKYLPDEEEFNRQIGNQMNPEEVFESSSNNNSDDVTYIKIVDDNSYIDKIDYDMQKGFQITALMNTIANGENFERFIVFNNEANMGKTTAIVDALGYINWSNPNQRTLIVTSFRENSKVLEESKLHVKINDKAGKEIAISVDSENYIKDKLYMKLKDYPVVIITHAMYRLLSCNPNKFRNITEDRRTLIIDEDINMVDILHMNNEELNSLRAKLVIYKDLIALYDECTLLIHQFLQEADNSSEGFFELCKDVSQRESLEKKLKELRNRIDVNVDESSLNETNILLNESVSKFDVLSIPNIIADFYNKPIYYTDGKLFTYNSNMDYFMLRNNILLDASAGLSSKYKLSDRFVLNGQTRITNHSNWTLHKCDINTSAYAKKGYHDFYTEIQSHIVNNSKTGDKILVIGNQKDSESEILKGINVPGVTIDIAYFGNIVGSNEWRDFNKVYIIHTPNVPWENYIINYQYYYKDGRQIFNTKAVRKTKGTMKFVDPSLEEFRKGQVAIEVYQAIKRINRSNKHDADVYLIMKDKEIIDMVEREFVGIKPVTMNLNIRNGQQRKGYDNGNRFTMSWEKKLIDHIKTLMSGRHSKSDIMAAIDYSDRKNFGKLLLKSEVKTYMEGKGIKCNARDIEIP